MGKIVIYLRDIVILEYMLYSIMSYSSQFNEFISDFQIGGYDDAEMERMRDQIRAEEHGKTPKFLAISLHGGVRSNKLRLPENIRIIRLCGTGVLCVPSHFDFIKQRINNYLELSGMLQRMTWIGQRKQRKQRKQREEQADFCVYDGAIPGHNVINDMNLSADQKFASGLFDLPAFLQHNVRDRHGQPQTLGAWKINQILNDWENRHKHETFTTRQGGDDPWSGSHSITKRTYTLNRFTPFTSIQTSLGIRPENAITLEQLLRYVNIHYKNTRYRITIVILACTVGIASEQQGMSLPEYQDILTYQPPPLLPPRRQPVVYEPDQPDQPDQPAPAAHNQRPPGFGMDAFAWDQQQSSEQQARVQQARAQQARSQQARAQQARSQQDRPQQTRVQQVRERQTRDRQGQ